MARFRLMLVLVMLLGAGCSPESSEPDGDGMDSEQGEASASTNTLENQPDAPPSVAGAPLNPFDLRAGQCFNEGSWYDEELDRRIELTATVDCEEPHHREVFHEAEFPAPNGAPYPGEAKMTEWSTQICYEAFPDFVDAEYELSIYEIDFLQPTQETFEHPVGRHRRVTCFLYDPSQDFISGSARGTGI